LDIKLEKQEKEHVADRAATAAHIRSVEDRAHTEVDRAREETKVLRAALTHLERSSQTARDLSAREHKEHASQLRAVERDASAQRARAEALEGQLKDLAKAISPQKSRAVAHATKARRAVRKEAR
jgi:hypothetical protein